MQSSRKNERIILCGLRQALVDSDSAGIPRPGVNEYHLELSYTGTAVFAGSKLVWLAKCTGARKACAMYMKGLARVCYTADIGGDKKAKAKHTTVRLATVCETADAVYETANAARTK